MCGIAGFFSKTSGSVDQALLRRMAAAISHRGPDEEGSFCDREMGVGLANRRLSIIDIAGGSQPMANDDETIWITYNGEIYNFRELKADLAPRGHEFKTRSDTEVVLPPMRNLAPMHSRSSTEYSVLRYMTNAAGPCCLLATCLASNRSIISSPERGRFSRPRSRPSLLTTR